MRGRWFLFILGLVFSLVLGLGGRAFGAGGEFDLSGLTAPGVMVADAASGERIFTRGENLRIPPASLAKVMTLYLIHEDLERGVYSSGDVIRVPGAGAAAAMRPGSSVLGLTAGDRVSVLTLMRAAAVRSAGDAAWTLALHSGGAGRAGGESSGEGGISGGSGSSRGGRSSSASGAFVERMNRTAARLGMHDTVYTDPDGWSEQSMTTPKDQLILMLSYIRRFPNAPGRIHSLKEMVFLDADTIRRRDAGGVNTNFLIGRTPGADGLKTGTLPESGFHLAATALRGGSRFIALVMGIDTGSRFRSLGLRADEAEICLEWAFSRYVTWYPRLPEAAGVSLRHGASEGVSAVFREDPEPLTLTREEREGLILVLDLDDGAAAPVEAGRILGSAAWYSGGRLLLRENLAAAESVSRKWKFRDIFPLR